MKKYKLLSLDIWDTVLRRKCHPDESKLFICRYVLLKYYKYLDDRYKDLYSLSEERVKSEVELAMKFQQELFDDEYHIEDVLINWLGKVFKTKYIKDLEIKNLIKELVKVELNHEKYISYLDENILSVIKQYNYEKCVYISDFYAGNEFIDDILEKVNCPIKFEKGFVSCNYKLNKKSGRLFEKVHNRLDINPSEHIHIGDNIKSDVKIPLKHGIESYHYEPQIETKKRKMINFQYSLRRNSIKSYYDKLLEQLLDVSNVQFNSNEQNKLYMLGKKYSIVFFTFILFIIEDVIKNQGKVVYYFTREGEFFKKIHDKILQNNPLGVGIPEGKVLEVSRMATFSSSLREITIEELKRLWSQYKKQSVKILFKTLNIRYEDFMDYFERYGIDIQEEFEPIYENYKIISLFNDNDFINELSKKINIKRNNLKSYFSLKGIEDNDDNLFIVDIGWRGSIQDNIACIYDKKKIIGYYCGLFQSFNKSLNNTEKKGFVSKEMCEDRMWIFKYVDPFEMLCNSPSGSTISYEYNEKNEVYAVRDNSTEEDIVFEKYVQYFQKGVLDSIENICDFVRIYSFTFNDLQNIAYDNLQELMTNPDSILAKAYFNLSHNETFGLGKYVCKRSNLNIFNAIKGIWSKQERQKYIEHINNTHWPQGFFNYYKLYIATQKYNNLIKERFSDNISLDNISLSNLVDMIIPEEGGHIKYYFDSININSNVLEIRGWSIIPEVDSRNSTIYLVLFNENKNLIYETFTEIRKDITDFFNNKYNYDKSGFLAKINIKTLDKQLYKLGLVIINDMKRSVVISENIINL